MDDFGSGYSSLNLLKDLHVDILKIDMAFLKKAKDEERSKKILQMVIGLSKHLDMPVITEGVETAEQVAFLSEMGCDMFQGYYFAKPMSIKEFEATYISQAKVLWVTRAPAYTLFVTSLSLIKQRSITRLENTSSSDDVV